MIVGRQPPPSQPESHQMQNKRAQVPVAVCDSFCAPTAMEAESLLVSVLAAKAPESAESIIRAGQNTDP